MSKIIKNNVQGCKIVAWSDLKGYEFNDLKATDNRDISKLKNAMVNSGFNFPFYVWSGHRYVIDGKGRDIALSELEHNGYAIPDLPIVEIDAANKQEAKKLVLQASSSHGEITPASFELFADDLDLSEIDFESFDLGFDLGSLGSDVNIDDLPDAQEQDFPELKDGDREPFQQMTFTLHDTQAEQIKEAIEMAKTMGDFDSENKNSNGNALARICETFITKNE